MASVSHLSYQQTVCSTGDCLVRSRDGVHTTEIELATKILDSDGKPYFGLLTFDLY